MGARCFLVLCVLVCIVEARIQEKLFNVNDYGAIADGKTDNSVAFLKAWNDTCKWGGKATFLIPEGTNYLLNPIVFSGPCNGWTNFQIKGILKASTDPSLYTAESWINFKHVNQLIVNGGGILDGQGSSAWAYNDCKKNINCSPLPNTMNFAFITNGYVEDLQSIDSKLGHFKAYGCENMTFTNINIRAPGESPNTDGIKIGTSKGISITNVNIGTGDDCIAIISGSRNVNISNVFCGPGHGISIGSLGKYDWEEDVADIFVKNCTIKGTSNGVRIKTWAKQLKQTLLKASNFVYEDILMDNVDHPIIIDQQYCPNHPCQIKAGGSVQISGVKYKNIRGSGNDEVAVSLNCNENLPCQNITLENIDLWRYGNKGKISNLCSHVNGASYGKQNPPSCL